MTAEHIHTSDAEPGDVLISLTHPRGDGVSQVRLSISDQRSGQTLIEVDLTAEEFASIMSSTGTRVSGARLPRHPERLGRRAENTMTTVPNGDDVDGRAEKVKADYLAAGWESVRIDRTNFGRRVVAYRWIDDEAGA